MTRHRWIVGAGSLLCLVALLSTVVHELHLRRDRYELPVDSLTDWKSYGGVWNLDHSVFRNNSEERGVKLMGGSPRWTNTSLSADVRIDQIAGDIGLMIRSNDEDLGVDAYNGYYAGLRAQEDTLIAGRSNYSWSEVQPAVLPGGVHPGIWYHLQLVMYGCRLAVSARNLSTQQSTALVLREVPCVSSGRIGLRSLSSGGAWRNVVVHAATKAEFDAIAAHSVGEESPEPLTTEAAYAKHFSGYQTLDPAVRSQGTPEPRRPAVHLGDLTSLRGDTPQRVVVRGVVTLTEPDLYIEDATGGALISHPKGRSVNVGEGIEVTGDVHPLFYSARLDNGSLRIISTGTPAPPISVTPWQAASGAYDARFIEVEGHLVSEPHVENGYYVLDLAEGGETFRALYPDRSGNALRALRVDSQLRLRGVCVLGRTYTQDLIPFLIFLRSPDDVQVLQGPPWWTPRHVAFVACLIVGLAWWVQFAYFRFRQWQRDAILRERERIAHDIHDTMAQSFAGIGYQIQGLRTSILRNAAVSRDEIADQLASTSELVSRCHSDASHTIEMLGAVSSEEAGDLLTMLADRTYKLSSGKIRVYREEQGAVRSLSIRVRAVLFSIGQEAISNAITHGAPASIKFIVRYEKRSATMMIEDDGCGFDANPDEEGFGILGMRHRAAEIGGTVEILSAPGVGTRVAITFPLSRLSLLQRFRFRDLLRLRQQTASTPARG
ncbi:Histidine kinase [Bryocella elongata]|uniref:Histidine kinase n=1 Tax=Bryocella elongata TaxID=863522 RepID=A0A1H6C8H2_9BACT|nr:ATP-binding protein [Bryocella elongata]SEG68935.1 Histidine kinase [Bryocella elongata]